MVNRIGGSVEAAMSDKKTSRRRGVVLTSAGQQKLQAARRDAEIKDNYGDYKRVISNRFLA